MLHSQDNRNYRKEFGTKAPIVTAKRQRGYYIATGGELLINTNGNLVGDQITFIPGYNQIDVFRLSGDTLLVPDSEVQELAGNWVKFSTPLFAGEKVLIIKQLNVQVVSDSTSIIQQSYQVTVAGGTTQVTLPFSYQHSYRIDEPFGAVLVTLDGVIVSRNPYNAQSLSSTGAYYEPISDGTYTSKIVFTTGTISSPTVVSVLRFGTTNLVDIQKTYIDSQLYKLQHWYDRVVGNSPYADTNDLQVAIDDLSTLGSGKILVIDDITTTGFSIPADTKNLTIETLNFSKITKSGSTPGSSAFIFNSGSNRIKIKGFELVNWNDTGDYCFYATGITNPDYLSITDCILNSYTYNHNFAGIVTNYIYNNNM